MKKVAFLVLVFAMCLIEIPHALADSPDDILIVVNSALRLKNVSATELRDIFLRRRETWGNGVRAVPVYAKDAQLRKDFRQRFLKLAESEETRFWQRYQIKTGKSQPPSFSNTLRVVFKLTGAVGYVYRSEYRKGVANILLVLPAS